MPQTAHATSIKQSEVHARLALRWKVVEEDGVAACHLYMRFFPCCSIWTLALGTAFIQLFSHGRGVGGHGNGIVSKRVLILRTWSLIWTFLAFLGPYLYFRVLIFTILASFTQRMSIFQYLQALVLVYAVDKF